MGRSGGEMAALGWLRGGTPEGEKGGKGKKAGWGPSRRGERGLAIGAVRGAQKGTRGGELGLGETWVSGSSCGGGGGIGVRGAQSGARRACLENGSLV